MLAAETAEGVQHFHLDHLGTPRLITNSAGAENSRHTYFPFGEEASPPVQDLERRKFTGHERDSNGVGTSDDVDYMHARYCSPTLGRFLSADPRGGTPADPQSWNRFTYGLNNPIRFVDPNGEAPVDIASITGRSAGAEEFAGSVVAEFSRNTARSLVNTGKGFANAITSLGLLSTGKHPSVDSDFDTLMFAAETKTDFREQVLGPVAISLMAGRLSSQRGIQATGDLSRSLLPSDLGVRGSLQELRGTFSVTGGNATVRVDMISGKITNPFGVIRNLAGAARAQGATTLRVEGTIANEALYNVLQKRFGLVTEGATDFFEIPLE
jgi:RHS repeat-associated protein